MPEGPMPENSQPRVYLDHAATTPLRPTAQAAWLEVTRFLQTSPGNPGALHSGGRAARRMLEDARERLADALGADRAEVVFTSGATESAALGVVGAAKGAFEKTGRDIVAVSGIEHPAVRNQGSVAQNAGLRWALFPVGYDGLTDIACTQFKATGSDGGATDGTWDQVALASMCWVCSETGVIQPIGELVSRAQATGVLAHSDATQAVGNLPVHFHESGLDLLTLGGHKFGAPVGTGALLVKRGIPIVTDRPGGDQERKIRSGTPDVAGAVALSVAAEEAVREVGERRARHGLLRARLLSALPPGILPTETAESVPGIIHLSLSTRHPEVILLELDRAGIMASAGSACHAGVTRPSEVLLAMGRSEQEALGVLRVSLGSDTREDDIDRLVAALPTALESAKRMDLFG